MASSPTWTLRINGTAVSPDLVNLGTLSINAQQESSLSFVELQKHYAGT